MWSTLDHKFRIYLETIRQQDQSSWERAECAPCTFELKNSALDRVKPDDKANTRKVTDMNMTIDSSSCFAWLHPAQLLCQGKEFQLVSPLDKCNSYQCQHKIWTSTTRNDKVRNRTAGGRKPCWKEKLHATWAIPANNRSGWATERQYSFCRRVAAHQTADSRHQGKK